MIKNMKNEGAEFTSELLGFNPKKMNLIRNDILKYFNLTIKEKEKRKKFLTDKGLLELRRQIELKVNYLKLTLN